ncbi:4-diphosphocytidyl-2-C-methylerythritol kinase [Candidatus Accumulibacter aalborgensis]|uniref:4-diphosphocytidyl-2-C-methyl-D-erythritol kinase n=1 Tax=Candidatus Accumulibacter aalborgensis TaxID=1860102 RepID=A0A1A8XV26_9PROT|nr:4-(cytidine 5'-diphospho)-2-C-methyl-D-erythritol kinase [Candidatus Accumulibacter aalborgensis]SBT07813.1 4-diphosphocytidyl-2-C-methylerythritol kinase [Candidatus Accumulibacter aalborgensis]
MEATAQFWNWQSVYPAPAKLNLFLHVVGRRADGYHLLQTVFRFLDRGDSLRFVPRSDGAVHLVTPLPGVPAESDLTVRAARLLQAQTACRTGVDIRLEKRLPLGGGLGGGSSDAATVLLALNHLWQLGLPRRRLQEIGLALGADVPVFVFGRNAFAEGIGETLQAVDVPPSWYVVVEPPVQVPTAAIFGAPELTRDSLPISAQAWRQGFGGNDLEAVACARFPVIAEHLARLSACSPAHSPARMSGSGACVFAAFDRREEAESALQHLPSEMRGWLAAGLDQHPLLALAE